MKCRLLAGSALRSAVFAGVTLALAGPAWAQPALDPQEKSGPAEGAPGQTAPGTNAGNSPADEEPTIAELDPDAPDQDTILVTGSRIPRPQFEGNFPGAQVTAEQIESRGFTHLFDILNDIPIMGQTGANPYSTGGAQAISLGVSFGDLLDVGSNRTITLVNGRRFVSGNSATLFGPGGEPGNQVDLSVIPAALISRVDVLAVGGAAQYGSDAVGGVINVVLKDDFEGISISGTNSISHEGDLPTHNVTAILGKNFAGGRGNVTAALEYSFWTTVLGESREEYRAHYLGSPFLNALNGTRRNPNFVPTLSIDAAALNNGPFLRAIDDNQPQSFYLHRGPVGGNVTLSDAGTVFLPPNSTVANMTIQGAAVPVATAANTRPLGFGVIAGNQQIVPYGPVPVAAANCSTSLATFCRFAPSALPTGVSATTIISRFAPGFNIPAGTPPAQVNALALALLQHNLPTIGEYFSSNPNTDINLILGLTAPAGFPTVPNTDPATSALFPRIARPIKFDDNGNLVPFTAARPQPNETSGTLSSAVGGDFLRNDDQILLRVQQEKKIGTLLAHYDVTDNVTVYTENLYADIRSASPRRVDIFNNVGINSTELAGLVLNINNPFLDAADRAALRSAGVTNNFMLSRTNVDVNLGTPNVNIGETLRTLLGVKGDFGLLGRSWSFDMAGSFGRADQFATSSQIKDIEYGLAIDAVDEGLAKGGAANGVIRCRAQVLGQTALPPGVQSREFIREVGADGIITERLLDRVVTPQQVAACVPLNPFGYNQMSEAAKDYVRAQTSVHNVGKQYLAGGSLSGSLFDLPGGPLGVAAVAEYRRESFDFEVDDLSRTGATRTAAFANTSGTVQTTEFGVEARIPIFGDDFTIPLFQNLEISPAIRVVKSTGFGPDIRRLNGTIDEQRFNSDWNTIWSLAGTWRPITDLTIRGSYTRSIRAASVVELFLGGQPSFNNGTQDICGNTLIDTGPNPAVRRANCEAAVIALGIRSNNAGAKEFLQNHLPNPLPLYGSTAGSTDIDPERGTSWGVGAVFKPRFLPGLTLSADYISATITDRISNFGFNQAVTGCYDSPSFPDTTGEAGLNFCDTFSRQSANSSTPFLFANGFTTAFRNLGAIDTQVLTLNGIYSFPLNSIFGGSGDAGRLMLSGSAQHLFRYRESFTNDFNGTEGVTQFRFDDTPGRPKWELQLTARYDLDSFFTQWTTNWQTGTLIAYGFNETFLPETHDIIRTPDFALHNATIGWNFGEQRQFGLNLIVNNVFDKRYSITEPAAFAGGVGLVNNIGRTYTVSANIKF